MSRRGGFVAFEGAGRRLMEPDKNQDRTIVIEAENSSDFEVSKISDCDAQKENDARSNGKRWKKFGNGDNNESNFDGDVVNNYGKNVGNIYKGENAANNSGNAKGSIVYDESNPSEAEDWEDFGNGKNNCHNFGGRVVNNNGGKPKGKK